MSEKVLVIAPHPDDEALGCGGTICAHAGRGDEVHVVYLTSGERGIDGVSKAEATAIREKEASRAGELLSVQTADFLRLPDLGVQGLVFEAAAALHELLDFWAPDIIYVPHPLEAHPDHQAAWPILREALLPFAGHMPDVRGYEVWTPLPTYDWPEDITPFIRQKLRAVRCYASQLENFRYDRAVRGLNQYRGALAQGFGYAEVFASQALRPGED